MKPGLAGVVFVVVGAIAGGCATSVVGSEAPRGVAIEVKENDVGARGATCGAQPELARGAVPADARVIMEIEMTSPRAESLRAYEDLARLKALEVCATNVSLLRAVDDDGRGMLSVTAALWERLPPPQ